MRSPTRVDAILTLVKLTLQWKATGSPTSKLLRFMGETKEGRAY